MRTLFALAALALLAAPGAVMAQCSIDAAISAALNVDGPDLGSWAYTMDVTWDTGETYALSHFGLVLDTADGNCDCALFEDVIAWETPAGTSSGDPDCTVAWGFELNCQGDPSVPGGEGIMLKVNPLEDQTCHPGTTGTATLVFYSDLPPVPIEDGSGLVLEKFGTEHCWGDVSGVFPNIPCGPVPAESASWSTVKALYGR